MDVALSDLLTCPRCGPTYGLVLVPYDVSDRRVRSGVLGCANCRERYPVADGVADLRVGPDVDPGSREAGGTGSPSTVGATGPAGRSTGAGAAESEPTAGAGEAPEVRLAGLMGLAEARGTVLLAGPAVAHAAALGELVAGIEVVARVEGSGSVPRSSAGDAGVSRLRLGAVLPFRSGSLRGVALTGGSARLLDEGARVLGSEGRLVVDPAPDDARSRVEAVGLKVVAEEGRVMVAARRP